MTWKHDHVHLVRIIDADTIVFDIDHGFGVWSRGVRVRIRNYDAPELRSYSKRTVTEDEKEHAQDAIYEAQKVLQEPFYLITHKGNSFNRWLGDIIIYEPVSKDSISYAELMIARGYAKRDTYE